MGGVGVGTTDIVLTCCLLFILMVLLLAFIFLALQGWYNESSFDSMVQAVMVSLSGLAMKSLRKKVAAEGDEESVKKVVGDLTEGGENGEAAKEVGEKQQRDGPGELEDSTSGM